MSSKSNLVLVINLTTVQQHVDIVDSEGNTTSVNIMPRKRVELEEGFNVCPNWVGRNPKVVKVHVPQEQAATQQVAAEPVQEVQEQESAETNDADSEIK